MAEPEDLQSLSLAELFRRAEALVGRLDSTPPASPEGRRLVADGLRLLAQAAQMVNSASLFSPNEDREDLATSDLRYLLVPFYRGGLLAQAVSPGDPAARRSALGSAQQQYMAYLHRARQYGVLGAECTAMLGALEEGDSQSEGRGAAGAAGGRQGLDPTTLREHKIAKFKREKAIKQRLEALRQRAGGDGDAESGGAGEWGGGDEEAEREAWLLRLDLAGLQAAERVGTLRQEMALLAHAASLPEGERSKERPPPPPELREKLLSAASALQQGLQGQRERLREGVFRPSHALPTMSVEQWGEVELQAARERQRAEQQHAKAERAKREERRSDDEDEEEVHNQRAWDDWKDDNPRGWGNRRANIG